MNKIKPPTRMVASAIEFAEAVRAKADSDENMGILYAAEHILADGVENPPDEITLTEPSAKAIILQFVQHLLEKDHFEAAATILWGSDVYDWRPKSSRDTWRCLFEHDRVLVQGAGAMGKSFGAAAWFYLDWFRDPFYTNIKVISLTREHAERNIFASIKNFHRTALVKPVSERSDELVTSIQANNDNKQGIHLVAIPKGESGHGTLRGFHPTPRFGAASKKWGRLSRTHVILDEAEEVPAGVWEGINNIISTTDTEENKGHIKIFGASNPKDRTSDCVRINHSLCLYRSEDVV